MKQFAVTVDDNQAGLFLEILKNFKFAKKVQEEYSFTISSKQKAILDRRLDNYNPNTLLDWDDVKKDLGKV